MRTRGSAWRWKWIPASPVSGLRGCWRRSSSIAAQPQSIRCDNGPELTSRHLLAWCLERKIELVHIQPGKPTQNAHVESFHGRLREECLRVSWFYNLFDARRKIASWRMDYNEATTPQQFELQDTGRVCSG